MVTPEERQEIIDAAVEKALLTLPTVMGNLMTQHASYNKINAQFYKDYPDFVNHKDIVVATIEKVDGQNPLLSYQDKLKKAVPLIRESIKLSGGLNTETASSQLSLDFNTPVRNTLGEI